MAVNNYFQTHLFIGLFLLFLSSCGAGQKGNLIGDFQGSSTCPASGCADASASADKVSISADTTDIRVKPNDKYIEISGNCHVSTFPSHRIDVTVNGATRSPASLNTGSTATLLRCSMGRYNLYLNACDTVAAAKYNVSVRIRPMDEGGNSVPVDSGFVNLSFSRDSAAVSCN